jgi:hypothetical protein
MVCMTERLRVYFDTDETVRLAVNMEALKAGLTVSDFLAALVRRELAEAIKEAEQVIDQRGGVPPKPRRTRKPKSS